MEGNYKKWLNRFNAKQDVLTEDNVGEFMDVELSTKSTPTSGDTVLGRDSVTGKAVEIPTSSLGGNGNVDTSNLVPYTGATKNVNIGAYYFESSAGFKKTGGTSNQSLTADGGVFDLNTKLSIESQSTTGTAISFTIDRVYGTLTTPETGNITADVTNAKLGVTNIIIHNSGTAPTFGSQFKKLSGSGNYVTGVVNYIYCTFISNTEIIYSINQRS